jgi:hypothetical protein
LKAVIITSCVGVWASAWSLTVVTMYALRHKRCPIFLLYHMSTTDSFRDGEHTGNIRKILVGCWSGVTTLDCHIVTLSHILAMIHLLHNLGWRCKLHICTTCKYCCFVFLIILYTLNNNNVYDFVFWIANYKKKML